MDLVCCADMRYASEDAYFSIREIDIGMTADVGTCSGCQKLIPTAPSGNWLTGRNMDAEKPGNWASSTGSTRTGTP